MHGSVVLVGVGIQEGGVPLDQQAYGLQCISDAVPITEISGLEFLDLALDPNDLLVGSTAP